MFDSFEIKSYAQLNFAIGLVNALLLGLCLWGTYSLALTSDHMAAVDRFIDYLTRGKIHDSISLAGISVLWGWISTHFLRLHDRLHEPHLRMWRSQYDADFILRALLSHMGSAISDNLYIKAYHDKQLRGRLMQRLFYNFVGDETQTAPGRRLFFYTEMWKYWTLALVDLYGLSLILSLSVYHIATKTPLNAFLVLSAGLASLIARILANAILNNAHEITEEQIAAVKANHGDALRRAAIDIATDVGS